jgi:two-component system, OmpR family, KDP operon response regulator KdpE
MTDLRPAILIIEDELPIRRVLCATLQASGYQVIAAATAQEGCTQAAMRQPALILLDLGLPDLDGLEVTRRLREWATMPIIVLSARGRESDKIAALDAGADDYVTKPFGMGELLARIRVALRRVANTTQEPDAPVFTVGQLQVDLARRNVSVAEQPVHLTPIEYKLLATLVHHAGKVVTHRQLLQEVWGEHALHDAHYLWVYMSQLRHKLEPEPARPRYLLTEPGVGYRLRADETSR